MSNIEVGKPCIVVKTHPQGVFKKGQIIPEIVAMRKEKCGCLMVDIGIATDNKSVEGDHIPIGTLIYNKCMIHGDKVSTGINDGIWWFHSSRFAPIDNIPEEEIDQILDKILEAKIVDNIKI